MGHALADVDHTIYNPEWFYKPELMHSGGPEPERSLHMTNHKIYVAVIEHNVTWNASYRALDHGYGGGVRARIQARMGGWLVARLAPGQPAWTT
jgi:hypothetical protein